jgi:hypothetical protein
MKTLNKNALRIKMKAVIVSLISKFLNLLGYSVVSNEAKLDTENIKAAYDIYHRFFSNFGDLNVLSVEARRGGSYKQLKSIIDCSLIKEESGSALCTLDLFAHDNADSYHRACTLAQLNKLKDTVNLFNSANEKTLKELRSEIKILRTRKKSLENDLYRLRDNRRKGK